MSSRLTTRAAVAGAWLAFAAFTTPLGLAPAAAEDASHKGHAMDGTMMGGAMMGGDAMNGDAGMAMPKGDQGESSQAFAAANAKMHAGMAITYTGKPDVDFVRGMIAHHQGAIDMARVELRYGSDPELKTLAQDIITAQEKEIAEMKAWLARNGG